VETLDQKGVQEIKDEVVEEKPKEDDLIKRVYLSTNTGIKMLDGEAAMEDIKAIREANPDDDSDYVVYDDDLGGAPAYFAIKNGYYSPLAYPEPGPNIDSGEIGMTSMELYALAVTLPETIEKIIERETEPKPSLIDQARKIMTPTLVIVGAIVAIFLIAVMIGG
jgi:hypothetical protein